MFVHIQTVVKHRPCTDAFRANLHTFDAGNVDLGFSGEGWKPWVFNKYANKNASVVPNKTAQQ